LTGYKVAYLSYPKGKMDKKDFKMLKLILNATLESIELELGIEEKE
jgi:hypothetical protein